ncbi:MAG: hypothetical protein ACRDL5_13385, partial [Solirubrobacteraceae bacterium]
GPRRASPRDRPRPGPSLLRASASSRLLPSAHALRVVDLAMAIWVAVWIGLGVAIGIDIHHLARLSQTMAADGTAVEQVGRSLSSLSSLPLIGGEFARTGAAVSRAGARAVTGGASSGVSFRELSVLLAIAVALVPSVPVVVFYLPLRVARSRETRAVRRALREHDSPAQLKALLAERAVARLDYGRLRELANGSDGDPDARADRLAAAELRRLGIDPRALARQEHSR